MRKFILIFLTILALGLAGCIPQAGAIPTSTKSTTARPAPTTVLSVPLETAIEPASGCTVISQKPTPGPTAETVYPPITASDWVKGPASAKVTIIEYSDFQ